MALSVLLLGGLFIRCQDLDAPLLTFHPTRQYRSALIARSCFYDRAPQVDDWARRVAAANRAMQQAGEPPLTEWLACAAYQWLGREELAIGRAPAAVSWVVGAIPIYFLARRFGPDAAALIAVALYLFVPYGIVASTAFQPDALMTACAVGALLVLMRHHERPDSPRMLLAAAAVAISALVKPMSVFITVPALVSLATLRHGWTNALRSRQVWTLLTLALLPPTLSYGYGAVFGTLVRDQMRLRFVPALVGTEFFWHGWWTQIGRVFGAPLFGLALAGTVVARRGAPRRLLIGIWLGYAAFAVAFTYHMPTHDYYHLPFLAVAALAVAAIIDRLLPLVNERNRLAAWLACVTAALIAVGGARMALPPLREDGAADRVARYQEIGALADHHIRVLFLDREYGYPLMYHGELSGDTWPGVDDLRAEALGGRAALDANARFERDYADFAPAYFVVTDRESLAAQPDLQQLLDERTTVVRKTPEYEVYKFR